MGLSLAETPVSCRKVPHALFLSSFSPSLSLPSLLFPYTSLSEFQFLVRTQSLVLTKTAPLPCSVHHTGQHTAGPLCFCRILGPRQPCNRLVSSSVKLRHYTGIHRAVVRSNREDLEKPTTKCLHVMSTQEMWVMFAIIITSSQQHPQASTDPGAPLPPLPFRLGPLGPRLMYFFPPPMMDAESLLGAGSCARSNYEV